MSSPVKVRFLSDFFLRVALRWRSDFHCRSNVVRGGYQVLGLSGVATAPAQYPATSLINQSGFNNNNDSVLFHGATLGLELTY